MPFGLVLIMQTNYRQVSVAVAFLLWKIHLIIIRNAALSEHTHCLLLTFAWVFWTSLVMSQWSIASCLATWPHRVTLEGLGDVELGHTVEHIPNHIVRSSWCFSLSCKKRSSMSLLCLSVSLSLSLSLFPCKSISKLISILILSTGLVSGQNKLSQKLPRRAE